MSNQSRRKAVFIGDPATGKSALLVAHCEKRFPMFHDPTVIADKPTIDNSICRKDGRWCALELWDTPGQDRYDRLRPLVSPDTDWWPEARHLCPNTPLDLVGTQRDLRDSYEQSAEYVALTPDERRTLVIDSEEGESLRRTIKAAVYIETSAKTMSPDELESVFKQIASEAMGEHRSGVAQLLERLAKSCLVIKTIRQESLE